MKEQRGGLSRRQFLTGASVSAWLAATHAFGSSGTAPGVPNASVGQGGGARIRSLRLHTAAPLAEMKDVVHFTSWNAHSVFFWDPAGNLLEYIARQRGRILGFDEGRPAGVFATAAALRGASTAQYTTPGFPYQISSS